MKWESICSNQHGKEDETNQKTRGVRVCAQDLFIKGKTEYAGSIWICRLERFLAGKTGLNEIAETAQTKHIVNMSGEAGMPDPACHSLLSDRAGRILIVEPGNGFAEIRESYAVMSNFPMLILPGDLTPEKYGYYCVDRYETALNMIGKTGEGFTTEDALAVLDAVKQVQWAPTQVSFVYSQNENQVYYTLQYDFNHIRIHQF